MTLTELAKNGIYIKTCTYYLLIYYMYADAECIVFEDIEVMRVATFGVN